MARQFVIDDPAKSDASTAAGAQEGTCAGEGKSCGKKHKCCTGLSCGEGKCLGGEDNIKTFTNNFLRSLGFEEHFKKT